MPCRFYEAGYFGVPCLAARGFEIGRAVEEADCGWAFEAPYEDALVDFFRTLTADAYGDKRRRLSELPASEFVAGKGADGLALILR
jgi:succinoglycan biosynthesis protein ExoL